MLIQRGTTRQGEHPFQQWGRGEWTPEGENKPDLWAATLSGSALAKARIGKPMPRARANGYLAQFLDRVREANDDPGGPFFVDKSSRSAALPTRRVRKWVTWTSESSAARATTMRPTTSST